MINRSSPLDPSKKSSTKSPENIDKVPPVYDKEIPSPFEQLLKETPSKPPVVPPLVKEATDSFEPMHPNSFSQEEPVLPKSKKFLASVDHPSDLPQHPPVFEHVFYPHPHATESIGETTGKISPSLGIQGPAAVQLPETKIASAPLTLKKFQEQGAPMQTSPKALGAAASPGVPVEKEKAQLPSIVQGPTQEETTVAIPPGKPKGRGTAPENVGEPSRTTPGTSTDFATVHQKTSLPEDPRLPDSEKFLTSVDDPQHVPPTPPTFEPPHYPHPHASATSKEGKEALMPPPPQQPAKPPLAAAAPQGKPVEGKEALMPPPPQQPAKPPLAAAAPQGKPVEGKEALMPPPPQRPSQRAQESALIRAEEREGKIEKVGAEKTSSEEKGNQDRQPSKETVIENPLLQPLPPQIAPLAYEATIQASPQLTPETIPLYHQMIGTVIAMTSPHGDSRTEFVLNAPGFANSKFFGSSVVIQRSSTAPYEIAIELTGSPEAVTTFNQNLPTLVNAFKNQQDQFAFKVTRIEAHHEQPLVRRKGKARGEGGL
ncbi:MAG: hypothetical protein KGI80_02630 [Verrucomicrobiota bacterium]|nr:hypothetical protein [Verrucomicrobiota bacterium]